MSTAVQDNGAHAALLFTAGLIPLLGEDLSAAEIAELLSRPLGIIPNAAGIDQDGSDSGYFDEGVDRDVVSDEGDGDDDDEEDEDGDEQRPAILLNELEMAEFGGGPLYWFADDPLPDPETFETLGLPDALRLCRELRIRERTGELLLNFDFDSPFWDFRRAFARFHREAIRGYQDMA